MSKFKIAITDCDHDSFEIEKNVLSKVGLSMEILQCKTESDLIEKCQGVHAVMNQYAPFTENVLSKLPNLRLIVRYGVGVNNIDLKAASKYGVQVCNIPDYGMNEVADHAMALTLALTRKIPFMSNLVKSGTWDYQKSIPIFRHRVQTVGVIGLGRIGAAYAKRVQAFGFEILGCEQEGKKLPNFVKSVSFEELIQKSDIISIHCPSEGNIDLISKKELKMMKKTAYLINVSRGGIINEKDLNEALANKEIAGAGLDVASIEPIDIDSALLKHESLLITPHMAWYSEAAAAELKRKVAEETIRMATGVDVHYPVNKI